MLDSLIQFFSTYGYFAVFGVLLLSGFGLPLPEDITLVAGGFIASLACTAEVSFLPALSQCHQVHIMFAIGMAGVLLGDSTMFFIGRTFGKKALNMKFISRIISQERYEWAQAKFEKYGVLFVFSARFMPGLRSPIFIVAGITHKVSYLKFILTDGAAAIVSVPLWVYFGFWAERQLSDLVTIESYVKKGQLSIIIVLGLLITSFFCYLYIRRKINSK